MLCPSAADGPASSSICPLHCSSAACLPRCRAGSPGAAGLQCHLPQEQRGCTGTGEAKVTCWLCSDLVFRRLSRHGITKKITRVFPERDLPSLTSRRKEWHGLKWHISWTSRLWRKPTRRLQKTRQGRAVRPFCNAKPGDGDVLAWDPSTMDKGFEAWRRNAAGAQKTTIFGRYVGWTSLNAAGSSTVLRTGGRVPSAPRLQCLESLLPLCWGCRHFSQQGCESWEEGSSSRALPAITAQESTQHGHPLRGHLWMEPGK